jgi:hypothetical protein
MVKSDIDLPPPQKNFDCLQMILTLILRPNHTAKRILGGKFQENA